MPDTNESRKISRRKALQTTGALTVGCGVFSAIGTRIGSAEEIETADPSVLSDEPEYVDTVEVDIPNESPDHRTFERDGSLTVHWDGSSHNGDDEYEGWRHNFILSGGAAAESPAALWGKRYKVQGLDYGENLQASTYNDKFGSYPGPKDHPGVPSWLANPVMGAVADGIKNGAGTVFSGATELAEMMKVDKDNLDDSIERGFKYKHEIGGLIETGWEECCFFRHATYIANHPASGVQVKAGFLEKDGWAEEEFNLRFTGDQGDVVINSDGNLPQNTPSHPEDMTKEQREALGIKRVPKDADIPKTADNEEPSPEYVMTKNPMSIKR
ncbi:hypothetical protein ACFQJ7_16350 [Halovenus rubra]|uniref:Uncharacterized protein n=2 Tax=Halovenus rubra TaxID=869890 RepID=A0ABD5X950_9EURY|nr:hypothetical protein [Halovenus rubra]